MLGSEKGRAVGGTVRREGKGRWEVDEQKAWGEWWPVKEQGKEMR